MTPLLLLCSFIHAQTLNDRLKEDLARDINSKGPEIVQLAELRSGMTILDLLGGGGYYAELLAEVVGDQGRVYLHNNKAYLPYVNKQLTERLANNRLPNVIRFDKELDDLAIEQGQFDAVFFILGYHDIYHKAAGWNVNKQKLFAQLFPAMKANAKLVIVDHSAIDNSGIAHAQKLHRIDKKYVIDEVISYGFTLEKTSDLLSNEKDSRLTSPFEAKIRRKTDRFVLVFSKT